MSGTYTYPTEGTFEVTNNKSGGELSVTTTNENIATASISGNIVTVKPGTIAGEVDIVVTSKSNGEDAGTKAIHKATVENGEIKLTVTPYTGNYDGKAHNAVEIVELTPKEATLKYQLKEGKEGTTQESNTIPQVTGANEYTVSITASQEGYTTKAITHTVTIKKADDKITLSETQTTITDFNNKTFTATHVSDGALSVTSSNASIATASIDTTKTPPIITVIPGLTVGDVTITVTSKETSNYNGTSATYKVTRSIQVVEAKKSGKSFNQQLELQDSNGNKVVLPEGFKVATDSGDNVTEGIVIEDNDIKASIGEGRGNQYVWIPVSNIDGSNNNPITKSDGTKEVITLGRYEFADGTTSYTGNNNENLGKLAKGKEILRQYGKDYGEIITIQNFYQELSTYQPGTVASGQNGKNRTAKELDVFINSVKENRGYYMARYEASYGTDRKPNSKVSNNPNNTSSAPTTEGYLWNWVTQIQAAQACENMYKTVKSDLVNSYAWDTAIVYIQKFSGDNDYSRQDGKSINGNIANTGKNNDSVCKIHDMASNCVELTTENSKQIDNSELKPSVFRGGYYDLNVNYTSVRSARDENYQMRTIGFRPILYIGTPVT